MAQIRTLTAMQQIHDLRNERHQIDESRRCYNEMTLQSSSTVEMPKDYSNSIRPLTDRTNFENNKTENIHFQIQPFSDEANMTLRNTK